MIAGMGKFFVRRLAAALAAFGVLACGAAQAQYQPFQTLTGPIQAGPTLVVDAGTGEVLHEAGSAQLWHPASLAKLMTIYIVFEELKARRLSSEMALSFSPNAHAMQPSKLVLAPGATITIDQALRALIARSANDVAVALAERISGSEPAFAERMTQTARRMGMTATVFRNASGWKDPEQVTTARDMAMLALALLRDFGREHHYFATKEVMIAGARVGPGVRFLDIYPGADGFKTGYLCSSGFNIVATATRDGRRLVGVALGFRRPELREDAMSKLFDEAFAKKSGGAGRRVWQLPGAAGVTAPTVIGESECGRIRYDFPGPAAWVGTFGSWREARVAHDAAQARLSSAGFAWQGREFILPVQGQNATRQATIVADLEPQAVAALCAAMHAKKLFCQPLQPHEIAQPFGKFWR
jgi:D-alanyl-D-alanine carboxypeptidase